MKLKIIVLIMSLSGLAACFEPDKPVTPHMPGDEMSYEFMHSMYTSQSYFDLGSNEVVAENNNSAWVLRFGSQEGDSQIGINSADYWAVYNSRTDNPDSIPDRLSEGDWDFDKSSGEPDSTAFAGWVSFPGSDTSYSHYIFILGKYDGVGYRMTWGTQFLFVNDSVYRFRIKAWPDGEWAGFEVSKNPFFDYRYFSTTGEGGIVQVEPERDLWDLQFTQYGSILYTSEGVPTPYYVRGVLLNRNGVAAALDTVNTFESITHENIPEYTFSTRQDFIGYDWKSVEVDVVTSTAIYTVNANYVYIIRDTEGVYYKMRFVRFYNDQGEKGFPVIEHIRL